MRIKNAFLLPLVASLAACATPPTAPESEALSAEALLRAEPLTGPADVPTLSDVDVLLLDQQALTFLDEHVNRKHVRQRRIRELVYAITEVNSGLEYDDTTRTAQEAFQAQQGNCLSFTNMFVAMAREIGLEVSYQEVQVPRDWTVEGGTYVLSRHVNAFVDLGDGRTAVVDFNNANVRSSYEQQLISDERALAHYYSNVGVEYLQKDELLEALRYFRKALASDPEFAPAWSNMGVLYSKADYFDYAEAAYLQALEVDPWELVAISNLGQLYEHQGRTELAEWYMERSNQHRMRNPYFRYHLARKAFLAEDYEEAIDHLEYSVRTNRNEGTFHSLMGLSYLRSGDEPAARRWLAKADKLAQDERKPGYHGKLERLLSQRGAETTQPPRPREPFVRPPWH